MLSNAPEGFHNHTQKIKKKKKHLGLKVLICIPAFFFASAAAIKSSSSPLSSEISGGLFAQSISVLSVTLRLLHSSLRLALFVSCNSVVVPCGLVGTSGAEDLTHKDALSLQQQRKKVISVAVPFKLRVSHPRAFDLNPAFLSTICSPENEK